MNKKNFCNLFFKLAAAFALALFVFTASTAANASDDTVQLLFTHDIHSYLDTKTGIVDGKQREYGNIARLSTLLKQYDNDNSLYVDAGDCVMGTLYQAAFSTDAYEWRLLGRLGCRYMTLGNHEFDYGCEGLAEALRAALASGEQLPVLVESSFDFSGEPGEGETELREALSEYGMQEYVIEEINGVKLGIFALEGPDSIECVQSDVNFYDYKEVARRMVAELSGKCDIILCLSHTGTDGDGENGEDFELIKEVSGIDVVISAHSHTAYSEPIRVNDTILVSAGNYLQYLGRLVISKNGPEVYVEDYELIPIDETVEEDAEIRALLNEYKLEIKKNYLNHYAAGGDYDDVLCTSDFDFMPLTEMYETHQEYPLGNLIADSYLYEAEKQGITDIDVALVGLGTVRDSIMKGEVTLADAFEICSLGVGADGSAGHPLLTAYITGEELKLLVELDASLGKYVSSIKMSYSGLEYEFNTARVLLDRVTRVQLVRNGGVTVDIEDEKLYKVCCNMYAANMLDMLNGLTGGILKIVPKDADGNPVTDFYSMAIKDYSGSEVKEWVAFKDYLSSFADGKIPAKYAEALGRKVKVEDKGPAAIANPGLTTWAAIIAGWVVIAIIVLLILTRKKRRAKRLARRQRRIKMNTDNIRVITHSSIKITGSKVVYLDPYDLEEASHDADVIFISHEHYDHFDPASIALIAKADTLLVAPEACREKILSESGIAGDWCEFMEPGDEAEIDGIKVTAVPSYNLDKQFHTRDRNWLGYRLCLDGVSYYYTGDCDATDEAAAVACDVLLLPIGGKYTMTAQEAAALAARIRPRAAVPTHYGNIIGTPSDADIFEAELKKLAPGVKVVKKEEKFK